MDPRDIQYLSDHLARREVVLVTGAGFAMDARDGFGRPVPSVQDLRDELWRICFGITPVEPDTSLGDICRLALTRHQQELAALLQKRLRVDHRSLPGSYKTWFAQPWERVYTLNVDDLDLAVAAAYDLPRPVRSVSAVSMAFREPDPGTLEVVHLNGSLEDDPARLTFSWPQYGDRLSTADRFYSALVRSWRIRPVVFVGTKLEEPALWQHLMMGAPSDAPSPRSFLIVPELGRAKQALLSDFGIQWIPMSAADFAGAVLSRG